MRRALKFLHTVASCGIVGALFGYAVILVYAPQDTPRAFADARHTISALCNYVLLPSLAVALVSGLLAMAVHRAFLDTRWAWLKALLGLSMFEATFAVVQSKATTAAADAAEAARDASTAAFSASALPNEWTSLAAILALSFAQIALGIWRPRLVSRK
jgi:uncharacterized membrane protein